MTYTPNLDDNNIYMVFECPETKKRVLCHPSDCPITGTPISYETGEDMEYIGLFLYPDEIDKENA